jgi:hypothetical protein
VPCKITRLGRQARASWWGRAKSSAGATSPPRVNWIRGAAPDAGPRRAQSVTGAGRTGDRDADGDARISSEFDGRNHGLFAGTGGVFYDGEEVAGAAGSD